eukprot:TRINITY_DN16543_c0_g1_i1.p1 TRINITY_DN16543_c0_g1~~TRINITY_DN16543_c0_g1_i1.p1  ORF type:complete len:443 (+),score=79.92 TRINITY_DN16543_c0_g1_i1:65-1330(+)
MNIARTYRGLLRAVQAIHPAKFDSEENNLAEHIMERVRTEKLMVFERDMEESEMEDYLTLASNKMENLTLVLETLAEQEVADAPALFSFLSAANQGLGGVEYHRKLEDGFIEMADFHDAFKERLELEHERGSELKNRALQTAAAEYTEILAIIANPNFQQQTITSLKPNCSYTFREIPETVVSEVDNERKRNCIYIQSPFDIRENAYDEHVTLSNWTVEPDSVWFTEEYHLAAQKIVTEIIESESLNPDYPTVLTGHSIGAALSIIVAAYLKFEHQYDILNVVTFGQPMITTTISCPVLTLLPIMRIFTPLDGFVETPASAEDGAPFTHYGEALSMLPSKLADQATPEFIEENKVYVTIEEYDALVNDTKAILEYHLPPYSIPVTKGYGSILRQTDVPLKKGIDRQKGASYGKPTLQKERR